MTESRSKLHGILWFLNITGEMGIRTVQTVFWLILWGIALLFWVLVGRWFEKKTSEEPVNGV